MAKKMILVDPQQWKGMQQPISDGLSTTISSLDQDMNAILENKNYDPYTKAKTYQQALNRYLLLTDKFRDKPLGKIELTNNEQSEGSTSFTSENGIDLKAKILGSIPKNLQTKASSLIDYIKDIPDIKWDQNLQLVIRDQPIQGSNAVDLIHDLIRYRKTSTSPLGWEQFITTLSKRNIPKEFVGNPTRLQWIERGRSKTRKPSKTRSLSRKEVKWDHITH